MSHEASARNDAEVTDANREEAGMGKSRDAKKNVKKKAKKTMKEKQQAKREKRNRWASGLITNSL
jgi:hypothetical protein